MNDYLSKHAWNMTLVFEILDNGYEDFLESLYRPITDEANEVIDSLLALADEQEPTVAQLRQSFDDYFKNTYPQEAEQRAKGWREWKQAHPNSSPYHF